MTVLLYLIFFLSGAAGVGYQIIWTRWLAIGLGHEIPSMLTVVTSFFIGMAVGSLLMDRPLVRTAHPGRWYGSFELILGAWAGVTVLLIPLLGVIHTSSGYFKSGPLFPMLNVAGPLVLLLPATAALGASIPAMEKFLRQQTQSSRCVGLAYGCHTLGAVAGALLSPFLLAPHLGFSKTILVLSAANLTAGILALAVSWKNKSRLAQAPHLPPPVAGTRRIHRMLFFTGCLGLGFETLGVRILSQVLENTIYSFSAALAVFLLGTAAGALIYQRAFSKKPADALVNLLLISTAISCGVGALLLRFCKPLYQLIRENWGDGMLSVVSAELLVSGSVFLPGALCMGMLFTHLVQYSAVEGKGLGRSFAWNTSGAALAPPLFGALLLPLLGAKLSFALLCAGYGLLLFKPRKRDGMIFALLLIVLLLPWQISRRETPPGGEVRAYREGAMATVSVVADANGHRLLRVNQRFQMGGTSALVPERRQGHLPLLLSHNPRNALFLGIGTGLTLSAVDFHPQVRAIGVELIPEIVDLIPYFSPENRNLKTHPRIVTVVKDARSYVRSTSSTFDTIVADVFHPALDGAGALYTREHFTAVKQRLGDDGLFCQWLPLHQFSPEMLKLVTRTFLSVFPEGSAWLLHFNVDIPVVALMGWKHSPAFTESWLEEKVENREQLQEIKAMGWNHTVQLLGLFLADSRQLKEFAGQGPLNLDGFPRMIFEAPEFLYQRNARSWTSLFALLESVNEPEMDSLLSPAVSSAFKEELKGFFAARTAYLRGLAVEQEKGMTPALEFYFQSTELSRYFIPSYARIVSIISALRDVDPPRARALFLLLEKSRPDNPLARQLFGENLK